MEIGPFRLQGDKLVENDGSWNEFANLLFGTRLSWREPNNS